MVLRIIGDVGVFILGDANRDEFVDISDPVKILGFLFLDSPDLTCPPAADANQDGNVDLGDPVTILDFLFREGSNWSPSIVEVSTAESTNSECLP